MALKPSKLNQIPQRNKDLAFGYLRENESKHKTNYCELIKYLVLIYSNQYDQFDPNASHKELEITENDKKIIHKCVDSLMCLSYLRNVVSEGIHIWKFRYICGDYPDGQIGVWKVKTGDAVLEDQHIDNTINDEKTCTGYAITMNGEKTNLSDLSVWSAEKFEPLPENGDIIEMRLDLNKNSLTFILNNKIIVQFLDIEHTSYRAAILTVDEGEGFTIISYQDIYG